MKVYRGFPERIGRGGFKVTKDGKVLSPKASQRLFNHSPNGFAWGYGGSGPAQLALALLLDVTRDKGMALAHYQRFEWDVIASFRMGSEWQLTEASIREWLRLHTVEEVA